MTGRKIAQVGDTEIVGWITGADVVYVETTREAPHTRFGQCLSREEARRMGQLLLELADEPRPQTKVFA